jgi:hypothetical protein
MRDSRNEGAPIFGDADPNTSSGIAGLYTKAEADAIVSDNSERGYGAPHYHAKSLAVAHEFAQGLAANLIRQVQQNNLRENKMIRIKKSDLKKLIREALIKEGHQDIIVNSYENVDDYNVLANYALTGDIAGALADPALKPYVDKNEMGWVVDEAGGWFEKVGEWDEMPAPEGWDRDKAYQFLTDLENAAWKVYDKQAQAAIKGDPDREFLEFLGNQWTSMIEPNDLPGIKWKVYKRYIRLKPPSSISHGVGEINISKEDIKALYPGAYEDFTDFLTTRTGGQLGRRAPTRRSPPPVYD